MPKQVGDQPHYLVVNADKAIVFFFFFFCTGRDYVLLLCHPPGGLAER